MLYTGPVSPFEATMSDIFNEVDEEVRRDKAVAFFNQHGTKFIVAAVLIVAGVAGWRFYQDRVFQERATLGARFEAALVEANSAKVEGKVEGLTALAEDKTGGSYPALAKFRLASELARTAKDEAGARNAASAFDALSNDSAFPADWRELAKLRAAYALLNFAPYEEIEKRLMPLSEGKATYRHSAREGIAMAAYKAGKPDKALDALQAIILDAEAPAGLRQRAEVLLSVVRAGVKS
jgi:hypothetical protein